nr:unnamed protein product [Callosobruchus chinensis]
MHLGKINRKVEYIIADVTIPSVDNHSDLGVIISSDLSWSDHIHNISSKAKGSLYLMEKSFNGCDSSTACLLYTTYIRPIMEFAGPVWHPTLKTMFVIEFSAPAEVNIVSKEEEKRTKYQALLGQLRRLWPDYAVSLLVMVIGSLGGMRNTLLSALRVIPVCRAAAHILAARMQKAGDRSCYCIAPPEVSEDEYLIESDSDEVQERCIPFINSLYDSDDEVPLSDIKYRAESLIPDSPVDKPNRDNIIWSDDDDLPVASFMESAHKASTSLLW